jgi:hypothetical protein
MPNMLGTLCGRPCGNSGSRRYFTSDRASVVRYVLGGAFVRVAVGLVLGVPLAVVAGRLIASELYGASFWGPLAITGAALIPATVAASITLITALRTE